MSTIDTAHTAELREILFQKACEARQNAYAPYSHFQVGAAVYTADGTLHVGANIENASYGLSCCAERVALFAAAAQGMRQLHTLLVAADTREPVSLCGACRQVAAEFATEHTVIICATVAGSAYKTWGIEELLPQFFHKDAFHKDALRK